ncbi:IS1634 family transposase [Gudongella sp. DL1XJH-153]|uniref:IS1634 family transposase n=1 Tax=Gudongella sp. DL1XJH-153 TaxID=3409804 RepID=UPI003BB7D801
MRLKVSESKNAASYYVIKDYYSNGKRTTKIVEKLGTHDELLKKLGGKDPVQWAKGYIEELNKKEKDEKNDVLVRYSPSKQINPGQQRLFNGGYLFLQKIYHQLGIQNISESISKKYRFAFNLDSILSRLVYGRIIFPSSKLATFDLSSRFIEQPDFDIQHVYRALDVISKETDFIQSELYKNSLKLSKRNTGVLYYDCTNYFFEIEEESGLREYGHSKDHKPNPIVQMGLFMDGDGIPLAFDIHSGRTNEQKTLKPLEKRILSDFKLSKFVVCTDAGLSSVENRKFNDIGSRAFITTQSVKMLKDYLKEWALDPKGWMYAGDMKTYDISKLDEQKDYSKTFFKERWINENGLEQRLIVTFSLKYRNYKMQIRENQIQRAVDVIEKNPAKIKKSGSNDFKRFIEKTNVTTDGEVAEKELFSINKTLISKEAMYDGFYAVCTNLEDEVSDIISVNHRRWEIEECFRIMKSEFKSRPVYLSRDERIQAHFTTCFLSLVVYRYLEKALDSKFTTCEIIKGLRDMNFYEIPGEGLIPTYVRDDFTDALHDAFGFRTDYQILKHKQVKNILKITKN